MAIARDSNAASAAGSGTTLSWNHTCSGSDRILIVGLSFGNTITPSTVTYNGVAMTQINSQNMGGSFFYNTYLYALIAPSTGTNSVSITYSSSGFCWGYSLSYTGVNQSLPTLFNTAVGNTTSLSCSVTTTADNSWLVGIAQNASADGVLSAGANTSIVQANGSGWGASFDTNSAQTPVGSKSCAITRASASTYGINLLVIEPLVATTNHLKQYRRTRFPGSITGV